MLFPLARTCFKLALEGTNTDDTIVAIIDVANKYNTQLYITLTLSK